jgi:hypothetical protein
MQYYRISAEEWPTVSLARTLPADDEQAGSNPKVRFADHPPSDEPIPGVLSAIAILRQLECRGILP